MRYEAILIDADDTLFDFRQAERIAIGEILSQLAIVDPDAPEVYHRLNRACWEAFERGEITQKELRVRRFRDLLRHYEVDQDAREVGERFTRALSRQSVLLPHALSTVAAIAKKRPVALVTNGIASVQRGRLEASPLREYLSAVVISEEVGVQKPDPGMIRAALKALGGVAPERAIMAGDSLTSDILAANRAGVDACWYNPHGKPLREGFFAQYEISDIREFAKIALQ